MRNKLFFLFLFFLISADATGLSRGVSRSLLPPPPPLQTPSPTPPDNRGLGLQPSSQTPTASSDQRSREAKPELVLQTGYNNFYGATRLLFSPDGRLLATATVRSNTVSLWETATNRKLRDLSTSGQSTPAFAPTIAFSRDSRMIATAAGDNSVTVWDVLSGRELQHFAGTQGTMMASMGIYFLAFTADNRLVTVSDAARVWDITSGRELRTIDLGQEALSGFNGSEGSMTISPDGSQLLLLNNGGDSEVMVADLSNGRIVQRIKIPGDDIQSLQLLYKTDGHLLAAGTHNKRFKFFDLTAKQEKDLGPTTKDYPQVRFSRDGSLLALSDSYSVKIWDTATLRELPALKVPNSGAFAEYGEATVAFSDDGKRIATGGFDTDTIFW
jgi:WD40 repeat protein